MGDGGEDGACGCADGEPFCGPFEAHKKCSTVRDSHRGVSFV
jgi:hypothetical protein